MSGLKALFGDAEAVPARRPVGSGGRFRRHGGYPGHEDEFDLIGDDDLGVADLGPIAPGIVDPDAGSGQIRKVTQAGEHQPR